MSLRTLVVLVLLGPACGCSEDPGAIRYDGPVSVQQTAFANNTQVTITSQSGGIVIDTAGESGFVEAIGTPFAIAPAGSQAPMQRGRFEATNEAGASAVNVFGTPDYGVDLTVHLPNPFHGRLVVVASLGNVSYFATQSSPSASIQVETGDIFVLNAGRELTLEGGTSNINVTTAATLSGHRFATRSGNIFARIPDAASLTILASSVSGGTVQPQPDQVAEMQPDSRSGVIVVGDGQSGTLEVTTGDGDVIFLRP